MINVNDILKYDEVQGIFKSQNDKNEIVQIFLYFTNPKWTIPTLESEPVGFTYSKEESETEDSGATITMCYPRDLSMNDVLNHVFDCIEYNYEIEERNEMFHTFIKTAQEKFIKGNMDDLKNLVSLIGVQEGKVESDDEKPQASVEVEKQPDATDKKTNNAKSVKIPR